MKWILFARPAILAFCLFACGNNNHNENGANTEPATIPLEPVAAVTDTFETGKIIPLVTCAADPSQSYALYVPSKGNHEALPVVYFFDPHGNGALPLNKYKALAELFGYVLAGSNNSRNGNDWPTSENIWRNLSEDAGKRLKIAPNRVYVCGFSGGAKVASGIGLNHPEVKGVIANGAGLPEMTNAGNFKFSFTAIAGEGDLNMTDLVAINAGLNRTQAKHRIIFFDGIHEWAPEQAMRTAFTGFQLDAMREKIIPSDDRFINNYIEASKNRIAEEMKKNEFVKAEMECSLAVALLDGIPGTSNWFQVKDVSIKKNPSYQKQWKSRQDLLAVEQGLKEKYMQQFQQADLNYWTRTISEVKSKARAQSAEGAMYQRLQAYLSLAFYSISSQLIRGNRNHEAQYFVELYKLDDATNSEAWYFSALLNARKNDAKAASEDLLRAIENGFTDKDRMMSQPEFRVAGIHLAEIESKMK